MYVAGLPSVTKAAIKKLPGKVQGAGNEWLLANCLRTVNRYLASEDSNYPRAAEVKTVSGATPEYSKPEGFPCPVAAEDREAEALARAEAEAADEEDGEE